MLLLLFLMIFGHKRKEQDLSLDIQFAVTLRHYGVLVVLNPFEEALQKNTKKIERNDKKMVKKLNKATEKKLFQWQITMAFLLK